MLEGGCETYSSKYKYRFLALSVPAGFLLFYVREGRRGVYAYRAKLFIFIMPVGR